MFIYGQKLSYHSDSLCVTFTLLIVPSVSFSKTLTQSPATMESSKDTFLSILNPGFKLLVETSPSIAFSPFSPEENKCLREKFPSFLVTHLVCLGHPSLGDCGSPSYQDSLASIDLSNQYQ